MEDIRASLSRMKTKFKQRLTERRRKPGRMGANPSEEGADPTSSLPQPEPHNVADKSHDREGDRADTVGGSTFLTDRPPRPDGSESVPMHGDDNGQEGGEVDVDGGEAGQRDSRPHPDIKVAVGGGRSGGPGGVYPSPSSPSISHSAEPNSA